MYKSFLIFLFLIICVPTLGQNLTKPEVDRLVKLYTEQEKYDSTSLMLVSFANQEHQKGNLDTALEYQIMNCRLVELQKTVDIHPPKTGISVHFSD